MAFGPSETLNQAVMEAFGKGGDFSSYFGSALATAAANLLAIGADAAAVPTAFAEVGREACWGRVREASSCRAAPRAGGPGQAGRQQCLLSFHTLPRTAAMRASRTAPCPTLPRRPWQMRRARALAWLPPRRWPPPCLPHSIWPPGSALWWQQRAARPPMATPRSWLLPLLRCEGGAEGGAEALYRVLRR